MENQQPAWLKAKRQPRINREPSNISVNSVMWTTLMLSIAVLLIFA